MLVCSPMRWIAILLLLLAPLACRSRKTNAQPTFTAEEEAQIEKIVERRLQNFPEQLRMSKNRRAEMQPLIDARTKDLIKAAREYGKNPNERTLRRFMRNIDKTRRQVEHDLQPLLTSADLNNFMVIFEQVIYDIRRIAAT